MVERSTVRCRDAPPGIEELALTRKRQGSDNEPAGRRSGLLAGVIAMLSLPGIQCCPPGSQPFGEQIDFLKFRGAVVDADTLERLEGASVGGISFTESRQTAEVSLLRLDGSANVPLTLQDGVFDMQFEVRIPLCEVALGLPLPPPILDRPDQVKVIVVRDGCEQTFLIDINEDTVVDLDFPDRVIELKEPILVSDCG